MQHSLWVVEVNNSNLEVANPKSSDLIAPGMLTKHFFRRIWQGKGSQTAASKVPKLIIFAWCILDEGHIRSTCYLDLFISVQSL